MSRSPRVFVVAGGGGVGKTTTSSALAWSFARHGSRTLVVTIDPARRLAHALGVELGPTAQPVSLDDSSSDAELFALMPDPRQASELFMAYLFDPPALERLAENRIFNVLLDAVAGMHELVALSLVLRAQEEHDFDIVVIDTAPSRNALDFITYPGRLASLLEARVVSWLAALAGDGDGGKGSRTSRLLGWGRRRAENLIGRILGQRLIQETAQIFTELAAVRERFAQIAEDASDLLLGDDARYLLVAAPTGAARDDVAFLEGHLRDLDMRARAILLNRAFWRDRDWIETLLQADETTDAMRGALITLRDETLALQTAAEKSGEAMQKNLRGVEVIRLPVIESGSPPEVVRSLSDALHEHLEQLR